MRIVSGGSMVLSLEVVAGFEQAACRVGPPPQEGLGAGYAATYRWPLSASAATTRNQPGVAGSIAIACMRAASGLEWPP
jgi:hypothetical protein